MNEAEGFLVVLLFLFLAALILSFMFSGDGFNSTMIQGWEGNMGRGFVDYGYDKGVQHIPQN